MKKEGSSRSSKIFKNSLSLVFAFFIGVQGVSAEEWITEEVLKQLSEVRQELKGLKEEVKSLKEAMSQPSRAQAKPSAGPIDIKDSPFIGENSAQIAIIEFSDYQCPYCRRHYKQTMPQIAKNYVETGKVKYVMKQFPLDFHAKARGASVAALCVEKLKPGRYFKAHESIFDGETALSESGYLALADSLDISQTQYKSCLGDPKMSQIVDRDMTQGQSVGVSGTPAFLVGKIEDGKLVDGQLITGARPFSSFSSVLDRL